MKDKKKIIVYQTMIFILAIAFSVVLVINTMNLGNLKTLDTKYKLLSEEKENIVTKLSECNPENGYDYIDVIQERDKGICFNCNRLLSFEDGLIKSEAVTVCTE